MFSGNWMPNFSGYLGVHQVERVKHLDGIVVAQIFSTTQGTFAQRMSTRIVLTQAFMFSSNGRPTLSRSYYDHHTEKVKHLDGTVFDHVVLTLHDILTQHLFTRTVLCFCMFASICMCQRLSVPHRIVSAWRNQSRRCARHRQKGKPGTKR